MSVVVAAIAAFDRDGDTADDPEQQHADGQVDEGHGHRHEHQPEQRESQMSYSLIANTSAGGSSSTVTTGAIETTGADLLIVVVGRYQAESAASLIDSKGNSWTELTQSEEVGSARCSIFYCQGGTVGLNHTFTYEGTSVYVSVAVAAFSGSAATPFDQENGASSPSTNSLATGSITPSEDNELVIAGFSSNSGETISINASMTITDQEPYVGGNSFSVALAYIIQTTAGAINPSWSWTSTAAAAARIASFKASAGAPPAAFLPRIIVI